MDSATIIITRRVWGRMVTYQVPIDAAVSRPEAAVVLCVSLRQIYRLIKTSRLPVLHQRGDVYIPVPALLEYRASRSRLPSAAPQAMSRASIRSDGLITRTPNNNDEEGN